MKATQSKEDEIYTFINEETDLNMMSLHNPHEQDFSSFFTLNKGKSVENLKKLA